MNRYTLHDRKVHDGQTFGYRTGERWTVLDRHTNKIVDEGTTRFEAQLAVNNWNAGIYDETPETTHTVTFTVQREADGRTTAQTSILREGMTEEDARNAFAEFTDDPHLAHGVVALYSLDRRGDWHLVVRSDSKVAR